MLQQKPESVSEEFKRKREWISKLSPLQKVNPRTYSISRGYEVHLYRSKQNRKEVIQLLYALPLNENNRYIKE